MHILCLFHFPKCTSCFCSSMQSCPEGAVKKRHEVVGTPRGLWASVLSCGSAARTGKVEMLWLPRCTSSCNSTLCLCSGFLKTTCWHLVCQNSIPDGMALQEAMFLTGSSFPGKARWLPWGATLIDLGGTGLRLHRNIASECLTEALWELQSLLRVAPIPSQSFPELPSLWAVKDPLSVLTLRSVQPVPAW
jgi:hypothetical protein